MSKRVKKMRASDAKKSKVYKKVYWKSDGVRFYMDSRPFDEFNSDEEIDLDIIDYVDDIAVEEKDELENIRNKEDSSYENRKEIEDNMKELENLPPVVKLSINNLCGNKNKVQLVPGEITVSKGNMKDLNEECIHKIIETITELSKEELKDVSKIIIPIYIFNINNVLASGNKNKTNIK